MNLAETWEAIKRADVELAAGQDGRSLLIKGASALTPELLAAIESHGWQILGNLTVGSSVERVLDLREAFDFVAATVGASAEAQAVVWSLAIDDLGSAEAVFITDAALIKAGWKPLRRPWRPKGIASAMLAP